MKTRNLLLLSSLCLLVFCFNAPQVGEVEKEKVIKKVRQVLTFLHFSPKTIDDAFSEEVFNRYMEDLDPYKRNFTQADIAKLSQYKDKLDDFFEDSNLSFYDLSSNLYYQSLEENETMVKEILQEKLNFDQEEYLVLDDENKAYPKNKEEKKAEWRRFIKYLILDEVQTLKEDSANTNKSKEELLTIAKANVKEDREEKYRLLNSRSKDELFNVYVNAFAEDYDPHTYYFSPKNKEYFDQNISGFFEGIGATLEDQKGYATITSLIIGGPAWKSKNVFKDDKIIEVAEEGKDPVNIVGMPLDDAIMLIRGKKGSFVTLSLKRADGTIQKVTLERDKIEIEDSYVKSAVLKDTQNNTVGYISIPSFYIDVNDRENGRTVSKDVKTEIEKLKKENVSSIVLDVRNNGGGSLSEVVNIVGLFIKDGPVVQVKNSDDTEKVLYDTDESISWEGPLAVMTNEFSASASEILAGAIQDYQRGIIIGSEQTYGKGTVQQVIPLERFTEVSSLGDLKLTIQKFYRITGASTQLKGVKSDIVIPDRYKYAKINESNQENPLPWDELNTLNYKLWNHSYNLADLQAKSQARLQGSSYLQTVDKIGRFIESVRNEEKIPLQYDAYMSALKDKEAQMNTFDAIEDEVHTTFSIEKFTKTNSSNQASDSISQAKIDDWYSNIKKDFYIQETLNILDDAM